MESPSKPTIPIRVSSKAALASQRIKLQDSNADLKRKISTTSFEADPVQHVRLRIEHLKNQKSEQHLHRSLLDAESEDKNLTESAYKKEIKETNKRIISLGENLWKQNQLLREIKEEKGTAPELGPDSRGAFVHVLLSLYEDPWKSGKRSSSGHGKMREEAIKEYEVESDAQEGKLWCAISGGFFDKSQMKAGHIVPHRLGAEAVDYIFGQGSGSRISSADNCILMHASVGTQFDNGSFVLLPVDPAEKPIKRWKIQMTNKSAINADMGRTFLKNLDGGEVQFKNSKRPAARFLYFHFVVTLLRNKRDRNPNWEYYLTSLPTGKPFATMGPYLRKSMLLVLAKAAGDLYNEEEVNLLGKEGAEVFADEKQLLHSEEQELARRVFEMHDAKVDEEEGIEEL